MSFWKKLSNGYKERKGKEDALEKARFEALRHLQGPLTGRINELVNNPIIGVNNVSSQSAHLSDEEARKAELHKQILESMNKEMAGGDPAKVAILGDDSKQPRSSSGEATSAPAPAKSANPTADLLAATKVGSGGDPRRIRELISQGASLNAKDRNGNTALCNAVTWNYLECVRALVAAGADLDVPCSLGCTALHLAILNGNTSCAKVLINGGANLNKMQINNDGTPNRRAGTPLSMAVELLSTHLGRPEIVAALKAAGASA